MKFLKSLLDIPTTKEKEAESHRAGLVRHALQSATRCVDNATSSIREHRRTLPTLRDDS
jgi:hypothetical protein